MGISTPVSVGYLCRTSARIARCVEDVILNRTRKATRKLLDNRRKYPRQRHGQSWKPGMARMDVSKRLEHALVKGIA